MKIDQVSLIMLWASSLALPYLVFAIHNSFRRKWITFFRALIAVGVGWLFLITYAKAADAIYRAMASTPAQIEALTNGDDAKLSFAIFFGWVLPAIIVGVSWVFHVLVLPKVALALRSSPPPPVTGTRLGHAPFFYVRQMAGALDPSAVRQVIRWCVLLVFVYLAYGYLMSVIFRAWQSSNMPDRYAIGMYRLALGHLFFSLGALFIGIGLFRGILTFPKVRRGVLALLALSLLLIATSFIGYFYLTNRCSNQGGTWSNDTMLCSNEYD